MVGKNLKDEQLKQVVDRTVLYLDKVTDFLISEDRVW